MPGVWQIGWSGGTQLVWLISIPHGLLFSRKLAEASSHGGLRAAKTASPRVQVLVKSQPLSCLLMSCWPKQASWQSPDVRGRETSGPGEGAAVTLQR